MEFVPRVENSISIAVVNPKKNFARTRVILLSETFSTLRVDDEIFESGKKKLRIQKHPDTCGRGLKQLEFSLSVSMRDS